MLTVGIPTLTCSAALRSVLISLIVEKNTCPMTIGYRYYERFDFGRIIFY